MREMAKYPQEFERVLVHTGQHYDDNMTKVFFEALELPQPDIYLMVQLSAPIPTWMIWSWACIC